MPTEAEQIERRKVRCTLDTDGLTVTAYLAPLVEGRRFGLSVHSTGMYQGIGYSTEISEAALRRFCEGVLGMLDGCSE